MRLRERRLHKQVFHGNLSIFSIPTRRALANKGDFLQLQRPIEQRLAEVLGLAPYLVITHSYEESTGSEASLMVKMDGEAPVSFEHRSQLFRYINESQVEQRFAVYAPVSYSDEQERARLLAKWAEAIPAEVERVVRSEGDEEVGV